MIVAFVSGCGSSGDDSSTAAPKRTMTTGSLVVGTTVNLLTDPGFGLAGETGSYGGFYGYGGDDSATLAIVTSRDSRSPAGLRGSVALLTSPGATDNTGSQMSLISSVTGGAGPFHAEVWLSKSNLALEPTTFDTSTVTIAMLDQKSGAVNLQPVEADARMVEGRKWLPFRADFPDGFDQGGYLSLSFASGGGTWHLAAPSVVAQPLVNGTSTRSLRRSIVRAQTSAESTAIAKLHARRPL